ncbi:MAG: ABC transporter permease, partial [Pseudobdellovibrio sp.]|nr:ABC transporter permease [Pseudobdellovibrio sp.]
MILEKAKKKINDVGEVSLFATESLRLLFTQPYRWGEVVKHMEFIGNQSVGIISLTSMFTGLALS